MGSHAPRDAADCLSWDADPETPAWGFSSAKAVGFNFTPQAQVGFLWARQNSRLLAEGPGGQLPVSELAIYNYLCIKSDTVGIWCDPFFGCRPLVDTQYSNQFETAGGITFRCE